MAKGDNKRTYKITNKSVTVVDHIEANSMMDKSDVVDRAIKYYYKQLVSGSLDDPLVDDDIGRIDGRPGKGMSSGDSGLIDRIRGGDKK